MLMNKSPTAFADILISIRRVFTIVAFAVIVALVVVCLIIISNTTRASVFKRLEIKIMKYVGATNSFIRIPFFIEGMIGAEYEPLSVDVNLSNT